MYKKNNSFHFEKSFTGRSVLVTLATAVLGSSTFAESNPDGKTQTQSGYVIRKSHTTIHLRTTKFVRESLPVTST